MSIRRSVRHYYGREWREVHRPAALARARVERDSAALALLEAGSADRDPECGASAGRVLALTDDHVHRCACVGQCGRSHATGRCVEIDRLPALGFRGVVVLTVAHLDQRPWNMDESNLVALCQACHNRLDAPARAANRAVTRVERGIERDAQSPQARLFNLPRPTPPARPWDVPDAQLATCASEGRRK